MTGEDDPTADMAPEPRSVASTPSVESERDEPSRFENTEITENSAVLPDVDELESRVHEVERVMAQLQDGDVEAADRAIDALEDRVGRPPQ